MRERRLFVDGGDPQAAAAQDAHGALLAVPQALHADLHAREAQRMRLQRMHADTPVFMLQRDALIAVQNPCC